MTTNFDNSGAATLGNCDVSMLTTVCNKDMITDAEFDALWEGNKKRFYVHQAWPILFDSVDKDGNAGVYKCTDEADAKVKLKQYLNDCQTGYVSEGIDSYLVKVYEGSDICCLYQLLAIKFKNSENFENDDNGYGIAKDPDLQKVWEANGQTGDYRDKTVVTECTMTLPLKNGVSSREWFYSWMVQNSHFEAIHTALKADGYEHVLNSLSGSVQKQYALDIFNLMKDHIVDNIPRGVHAGQSTEATPVFGYVNDNRTPAYSLGLQHQHPNYADLPDNIKPCGWPFTTTKIGGQYPPFD